MKISFVSSKPLPDPSGWYETLTRVEFFSVGTKDSGTSRFRSGITRASDLEFDTTVSVLNPAEFKEYMDWKSV